MTKFKSKNMIFIASIFLITILNYNCNPSSSKQKNMIAITYLKKHIYGNQVPLFQQSDPDKRIKEITNYYSIQNKIKKFKSIKNINLVKDIKNLLCEFLNYNNFNEEIQSNYNKTNQNYISLNDVNLKDFKYKTIYDLQYPIKLLWELNNGRDINQNVRKKNIILIYSYLASIYINHEAKIRNEEGISSYIKSIFYTNKSKVIEDVLLIVINELDPEELLGIFKENSELSNVEIQIIYNTSIWKYNCTKVLKYIVKKILTVQNIRKNYQPYLKNIDQYSSDQQDILTYFQELIQNDSQRENLVSILDEFDPILHFQGFYI